jgi:hypothetical protein
MSGGIMPRAPRHRRQGTFIAIPIPNLPELPASCRLERPIRMFPRQAMFYLNPDNVCEEVGQMMRVLGRCGFHVDYQITPTTGLHASIDGASCIGLDEMRKVTIRKIDEHFKEYQQ